jgi:serine protease Do
MKAFPLIGLVVAAVGLWRLDPSAAQTRIPPQGVGSLQQSFAPLVKQTAPAVVNIYTRKVVRERPMSPFFDDPFFRRFFGDLQGPTNQRVQNSLGSGVIVRREGIVVTNHHVIKDADEITVVLADRREFEATIVGSDERTDLAVLRIRVPNGDLPALELGDSDNLEVGDLVLAIGNPFGVGQTVTSGIVSALARTAVGISDYRSFIQTDAAINPGNSGGALVDMSGRLAGINTAIYSRSGGSIGIGFAIPANMVRQVVAGLVDGGRLVRPWLGASGQGVTSEMAASLGLDRPVGVILESVLSDGPAARAGLRVGDIVLAVNGREVDDSPGLKFRMATLAVGGKAEVRYQRQGRVATTDLLLVAPPETPPREATQLGGRQPFAGTTVANLSPALADELGLDTLVKGVIVLQVEPGSTAQRLGVQPGDIVLKVNDREITTVLELRRAIGGERQSWRLSVRRGDRILNVVVGG